MDVGMALWQVRKRVRRVMCGVAIMLLAASTFALALAVPTFVVMTVWDGSVWIFNAGWRTSNFLMTLVSAGVIAVSILILIVATDAVERLDDGRQ